MAVTKPRFEVHAQLAADGLVMNERTDHFTMNGRP